eukprot:TRINITY_DN1136_c0_g1_i1.p1 TRINITY_DN1136_c0_g1~~TRINITY_DN1136_c0_g1_i1.p1  ORF type:complete len:335 (-),score=44.41 TRINITY_DN1136_c0_g1_i1:2805-3809(-)
MAQLTVVDMVQNDGRFSLLMLPPNLLDQFVVKDEKGLPKIEKSEQGAFVDIGPSRTLVALCISEDGLPLEVISTCESVKITKEKGRYFRFTLKNQGREAASEMTPPPASHSTTTNEELTTENTTKTTQAEPLQSEKRSAPVATPQTTIISRRPTTDTTEKNSDLEFLDHSPINEVPQTEKKGYPIRTPLAPQRMGFPYINQTFQQAMTPWQLNASSFYPIQPLQPQMKWEDARNFILNNKLTNEELKTLINSLACEEKITMTTMIGKRPLDEIIDTGDFLNKYTHKNHSHGGWFALRPLASESPSTRAPRPFDQLRDQMEELSQGLRKQRNHTF